MNYYEEILLNIEKLIEDEDYEKANRLILNELEVSYIPKDFQLKLNQLSDQIRPYILKKEEITDELIERYLNEDETHQLIAVNALNNKNLRDYIPLCEKFLESDSYKNAKVLLIDSLINQEINHEFIYLDGKDKIVFNPIEIKPFGKDDNYQNCLARLSDIYMKEPSILLMAKQLLYKEAMFMLPRSIKEEEIDTIINKITSFIKDAFK